MSILLQIAIPVLVTAGVLIAIAVWRGFFRLEALVLPVLLLAVGIGALALDTPEPQLDPEDEDTALSTATVSLILAQEYLIQGEYGPAADILEDLDRACADDSLVQLTRARLAMLTGNYAAAEKLYRLCGQEEEERDAARQLLQDSVITGDAVVAYLTSRGADSAEYGMALSEQSRRPDGEKIRRNILSALEDAMDDHRDAYGKNAVNAAGYAAELTIKFREYLYNYGSGDFDALTDNLHRLMGKEPGLDQNPYLREARLKGFIAQGKYEEIAETASAYSTPGELVVLTELYVSGMVDGKDFSDDYRRIDKSKAKELIRHCENVLEKNKNTLSQEQYEQYLARLAKFEERVEDPVLFALKNALSTGAYGGNRDMRSKLFMALAKLEYSEGNVAEADAYVEDALGTATDSGDINYRVPMSQLASIVQGTEDAEEIKNVANYVEDALNHATCDGVTTQALNAGDDTPQETPGDGVQDGFSEHVKDTVTTANAMLNIGVINKDDFPRIQARVQIQSQQWSSLEEIKNHLLVYDCGSSIQSFELEKLEFQRARIILLCDVSGSMDDNEQALKDAVVAFANNMIDGEEVSVIGFSSRIEFQTPFSADPEEVASYADEISTGGNTALYKAALQSLEQFTPDINSNDIIIAMTDGQDGTMAGEGDMYNELGALAASKGVTMYTMGLGSGVDVEYLEMMADACNGSFLYAENAEKMNTFYAFIHGQLKNQYILSYTARNTTRNERTLELKMQEELGSAKKTYYLQETEHTSSGSDSYDPYIAVDGELSVYGFATKFLYKSATDQTLTLVGENFDSGDEVELRLTGSVQYTLAATYADSTSYTVTIPANVATGTYDLTVTIRGESVTLKKELTIAAYGTQKTFQFGDYRFTALESFVNDAGDTVLSGNVVMNGWLLFKGDITIQGNYRNAERVTLLDESGANISYKTGNSAGIAKRLAGWGISLPVPALEEFTIYSTPYTALEYEDFPVEKVKFLEKINIKCMVFENGSISVYPDMLRLQGYNFHINLPFQEQLIRNFNLDVGYQADVDTDVILGATQIAMLGEASYKNLENGASLFSLPIVVKSAGVKVDTLRDDYYLEGEFALKALKDADSMWFALGVKDGKFDSIGVQQKEGGKSVTLLTSPIPVSMSEFGFELKGFSKFESDQKLLSKILSTTVDILFKVDVANLDNYAPAINELISDKDIALATLSDCKLSLCAKDFRLAFTADVVLATVLDVGKCEIELGKFKYTNALIGFYNVDAHGLRAKLTLGSKWETTNLSLLLEGAAELMLGYPYSGLWLSGELDFDVGWWLLQAAVDVRGDAMIGAYTNTSGNFQFSVIVRGTDNNGDYAGFHLYITRPSGFQISTY